MTNDDGGPAFPHGHFCGPDPDGDSGTFYSDGPGMSLRDYFAAAALQGLLSNGDHVSLGVSYESECSRRMASQRSRDGIVRLSYGFADAMLKERGRQ